MLRNVCDLDNAAIEHDIVRFTNISGFVIVCLDTGPSVFTVGMHPFWLRAGSKQTSLSAPNDARQELPARHILSQRSWRHSDIRNGRYGQGIIVACEFKDVGVDVAVMRKIRDFKQYHDTKHSEVNVSYRVW